MIYSHLSINYEKMTSIEESYLSFIKLLDRYRHIYTQIEEGDASYSLDAKITKIKFKYANPEAQGRSWGGGGGGGDRPPPFRAKIKNFSKGSPLWFLKNLKKYPFFV